MVIDRQLWQSQNFLKNPKFVSGLVSLANITCDDLVVEIGAGKGIITEQLAERAGRVLAVEVDPKLARRLKEAFSGNSKVKIIEENFLNWQLPKKPYKVFSNPPFNMIADVIRKLLEDRNSPESAFLIMQDKAFDGYSGKSKENQKSLLLKPWFDVNSLTNINRQEYNPIPNVNTVLAEFKKREEPFIDSQLKQTYKDFVVYSFNQWKPTVMDAYGNIFSSKQKDIIEKNIKFRNVKPTDLSFDQWLTLFETFEKYVPEEKKRIVVGADKKQKNKHKKHQKWHRTR
jgi:23S rRNA (adenine-N6)-dimethyltransferase